MYIINGVSIEIVPWDLLSWNFFVSSDKNEPRRDTVKPPVYVEDRGRITEVDVQTQPRREYGRKVTAVLLLPSGTFKTSVD